MIKNICAFLLGLVVFLCTSSLSATAQTNCYLTTSVYCGFYSLWGGPCSPALPSKAFDCSQDGPWELPDWALGGSVSGSVGLGVDPCGNVGLVASGQLGGGYRFGTPVSYSGGVSFTYTNSPTIFGLGGNSPVLGGGGGGDFGGSVTHTLGGSTTVTIGTGFGGGTIGGVKATKVLPLICGGSCH